MWKVASVKYILTSSWTHEELQRTPITNFKTGHGRNVHDATAETCITFTRRDVVRYDGMKSISTALLGARIVQ